MRSAAKMIVHIDSRKSEGIVLTTQRERGEGEQKCEGEREYVTTTHKNVKVKNNINTRRV
jgi:hypothetical protein